MKFFLLLFLLGSILFAQDRPKIALVLSGGGARGGAHVGVLKVLEKNRIPIDMIIGTSMGSFMGGLYAAGETPEELEKMLVTTDWNHYIKADFDREKIPMQRKKLDYTYQGKMGVGVNAENELVFPTGVLKREPLLLYFDQLTSNVKDIQNFDELSISFRAVATDIKNGDAVVLKSGSLAKAIYASSAIPGGLQPININGIDLIDGGVSDNIPIDVARKMGADIIIAVDVSENFSETLDVDSYLVVMGQLVDILMRKNANESLKLLSDKDILIVPQLKSYSGLDVEHYAAIVEAGYQEALKSEKKLQTLSVSKEAYAKYRAKHRMKHQAKELVIDAIEIENDTYLSDEIIKRHIRQKVGMPLNDTMLREDILALYHLTVFDSVSYKVVQKNGRNILHITTTPSWNNHGDLLFSIALDDDFNGHSSYSLKAGYMMYGINSLGAEWRTSLEIGKKQHYMTEFYQPIDYMQMFYLRPFLSYEKMTYVVPTDSLGNQELKSTGYGGGLAFGANLTSSFKTELNIAAYRDRSDVAVFDYSEKFNARQLNLIFLYDSLDNYNFPNSGALGEVNFKKDAKAWGSDYDYEQLYGKIQKPLTYKDNTFILNAKLGKTNIKSQTAGQVTVYDKFELGGMFNLSGYQRYKFAGNNVAFASAMYRYRIKNGGFFGSLGMPLYAGATLESGTTWNEGKHLHASDLKSSGSIFVAADTPLGAFYFTYGRANSRNDSFYLYLGEKF
ncbi:patatin-like phospholipase family protein [Sulfurimonas paralvinellae]|uniref:BamA/TamA family outer membrane protein n=1 Tax=Sulfurimonas paralvinellae TaxID=317658 RepID=A0A7M1B8M8_9BACT|nr:patatin-like phospholipase family protein [Sulfurimonas paralvinellae]QOP45776.1 BamA/TamA family outer membrane protein [Sulfurimonas paralvinellae]